MKNIDMEEFKYQMDIVGYYLIEDFLTNELSDEIREIVDNEIKLYKDFDVERSHLDRHHLHDLIVKHLKITKLLEDERVDRLMGELLGKHWIMYAFTGSSCPPNGTNYGSRIHVDSPRWISNYPTNFGILWALDDFSVKNGATKILPGSHNSKIIPNEEYFKKNAIDVICKKGSVMIANARVVHSTGINSTDQWRHALTMNTCRPFMKQRMDWVRFIPEEISSQLNETARRVIGFDTRLPTNLNELFLPDEERLYKANQEG